MPERIALSHAFGGLAVALVGIAEYYTHHPRGFAIGAVSFWLAYVPTAGLAVLALLPMLVLATAGLFVLTAWLLIVSAVREGRRRHGELHRGGR
jgi:hypothetical protein